MNINAFKAYDIRGEYPRDINEDLAYQLGLAFVTEYKARTMVVGRDIRESSPVLFEKLIAGILDAGCDVISLGICGTEEVYFKTVFHEADGGIMITASHNPKNHNGFKLVGKGAEPISLDSGLLALQSRIIANDFSLAKTRGKCRECHDTSAYINALLKFIPAYLQADKATQKRLRIVCNSGNGCAGSVIDLLEAHLNVEFIKVHHDPDGTFPNGVPNPLLFERREATKAAVIAHHADFGVAWDGDFDRCFFFDETGRFIDSSYMVGLIATALLRANPGETIVLDTRQTLNSESAIKRAGGKVIISAGGHSPMKRTMREFSALYGGEMSAHHYFRDFHYCDSGMIPFLLMVSLLSRKDASLGALVAEARALYPCSGELNYEVIDPQVVIAHLEGVFKARTLARDVIDGLSLRLEGARINIRASNTENYLRINIETEQDQARVGELQAEIETALKSYLS